MIRRWRVLGAAATAFVLAVGVAGCGSDASPPEQDAAAGLQIWIRQPPGGPGEKTAQALAAEFTKGSGIPTTVTAIFEDFETKLQQAAAGKQLPDIVINDVAQLGTLVSQGFVREVDRAGVAGGDQVTALSWDAAKGTDGRHYAVPFSAQSFALFIRRDWREKLDLAQPKSWADLDAMAMAFTKQDPDGNGQDDTHGYVIPGTTKRGYLAWYFSTFLWSGGGDFFAGADNRFTPAIAEPAAVEAVEWMKAQFCQAGTVVPGAVTMETRQAHPMFESGKGGIYLTGPYNMARFDKNLGKDKYEVVPAPPGPSGETAALAEGENVYLMAGSRNEAGQQKFAEFAISPQGQTIGMAGDTEGNIVRLPVNSEVDLAEVREDERWQVFDQIYRTAGRYSPTVPDWTPFRQTTSEALNGIVANCESDTKAELDKLAGVFAEELGRQGVAP